VRHIECDIMLEALDLLHVSLAPNPRVIHKMSSCYGLATVSRIHKIIGLLCRIASLLQVSFAKETYDVIDPTNRSHPIEALDLLHESPNPLGLGSSAIKALCTVTKAKSCTVN